jgi:hypothetical protein
MKYLPDIIVILCYIVIAVLILGEASGVTWMIATSDLPDWVKFALLK